jgi:hypothetical protein
MSDPEEQEELVEMLDELLDCDEGLSEWEINFLDSLSRWSGFFTEKQREKLTTIYQRMFP